MFLRVRKVKFDVNREDHKELEKGNVLTKRFPSKGTEIKGENFEDEDKFTYTLSGAQFSYKKLQELQHDFPSLRFKSLGDRSWLDENKRGFLKSHEGKNFRGAH